MNLPLPVSFKAWIRHGLTTLSMCVRTRVSRVARPAEVISRAREEADIVSMKRYEGLPSLRGCRHPGRDNVRGVLLGHHVFGRDQDNG